MLPLSIKKLINHFNGLPGIGQKTAERLVFYLIKQNKETLTDFANTLIHITDNIKNCEQCGQITEKKICDICSDKTRQNSIICVVAENSDIAPLEKSGAFKGMYHVLYGTLNPTEGTTPDKLNIHALEERIKNNKVNEIILAFNPTVEGETTNLYLTKLLKKYDIKITKLARGLPQGADLEYADEITLANAFHGRTKI